jgi:hypothetical protein
MGCLTVLGEAQPQLLVGQLGKLRAGCLPAQLAGWRETEAVANRRAG